MLNPWRTWTELFCTILACVLLWAPLSAWSADEPPGTEQRAILDLFVNEAASGETTALLRGGDVAVKVSDLLQAGLHDFAGTRQIIYGAEYVALSSLAPDMTFQIDEANLALRVTADPKFLPTTSLNFRHARPQGTVQRTDTSAFLNYSVSANDFRQVQAFGEIGVSYEGHLLSSNISRRADGSLVRGLTSLKLNDPIGLRQGQVGDMFATSANPLGGAAFLGGIGVTREFNLDPYFYRFPVPNLSGTVLTPSRYEVYVNDQLVRRGDLQPGRFDLANLPASVGSGNIRVVTRDSFGRTHEVGSPYYLSTRLLAPGQQEYAYHAGFVRNDVVTQSFQYQAPAFMARHRIGVLDTLTLGLRVEGDANLVSGGPTLSSRMPFQLGEVELSVATSYQGGDSGTAASIAYVYWGKHFTLGSTLIAMSPHYSTISLPAHADRKVWNAVGFIGMPLGPRASVTLQYAQGSSRDYGSVSNYGANCNVRLTDRFSLFSSANHSASQLADASTSVFVGLNIILGQMTNATAFAERQDEKDNTGLRVQKGLPAYSEGYGYLVNASTGEQQRADGLFQYQGPYGRYELQHTMNDGRDSTRMTASGALVTVGTSAAATRPVTDSFAVIKVPGVEGVRGYLFNQEVGRTNSRGYLVVPNMLSYYGNTLSIEDKDIPLGYRIDATQQTLAPPLRGGVLASFPVHRLQAITGSIRLTEEGGEIIPAHGEFRIDSGGQHYESPLGKNGEFYFENLPAGPHSGIIEFNGRQCPIDIEVPQSTESFVKLGTLTCSATAL
jgi:outer membrane usher protein